MHGYYEQKADSFVKLDDLFVGISEYVSDVEFFETARGIVLKFSNLIEMLLYIPPKDKGEKDKMESFLLAGLNSFDITCQEGFDLLELLISHDFTASDAKTRTILGKILSTFDSIYEKSKKNSLYLFLKARSKLSFSKNPHY